MPQLCHRTRLAPEARGHLVRPHDPEAESLDGDVPIELQIARGVHLAEPPTPEELTKPVPTPQGALKLLTPLVVVLLRLDGPRLRTARWAECGGRGELG
jgi:hypothetical protein